MDVRFNLDQLFIKEPLKEEPFVNQDKIKVQDEEKYSFTQKGDKGQNEIISDLEEKEVESKPTMNVVLPMASYAHS